MAANVTKIMLVPGVEFKIPQNAIKLEVYYDAVKDNACWLKITQPVEEVLPKRYRATAFAYTDDSGNLVITTERPAPHSNLRVGTVEIVNGVATWATLDWQKKQEK